MKYNVNKNKSLLPQFTAILWTVHNFQFCLLTTTKQETDSAVNKIKNKSRFEIAALTLKGDSPCVLCNDQLNKTISKYQA